MTECATALNTGSDMDVWYLECLVLYMMKETHQHCKTYVLVIS